MADFTLNAPGTTNSPYTPANITTSLGTSAGIISDATGIRAHAAGDYSEFVHNVSYGSVITTTVTIASGGTSNGDEVWLGSLVRSGVNAGSGFGVIVGAFNAKLVSWTGASPFGGSTTISNNNTVTRANSDVWSVTSSVSAGTATMTVTQNGTSVSFGTNTTTNFTGEASLAAGAAFNAQNSNILYLSQFTGTGVSVATAVPHSPMSSGGFNVQVAM